MEQLPPAQLARLEELRMRMGCEVTMALGGKEYPLSLRQPLICTEAMLLRLLKSPEEASEMGARGRELVREKFPWRKMSDTLIREYESFLGEKCSA